MIFLTSRRLLLNLIIIVAAVAANAMVGYAQNARQREADQALATALDLARDLERFGVSLAASQRAFEIRQDRLADAPGVASSAAAEPTGPGAETQTDTEMHRRAEQQSLARHLRIEYAAQDAAEASQSSDANPATPANLNPLLFRLSQAVRAWQDSTVVANQSDAGVAGAAAEITDATTVTQSLLPRIAQEPLPPLTPAAANNARTAQWYAVDDALQELRQAQQQLLQQRVNTARLATSRERSSLGVTTLICGTLLLAIFLTHEAATRARLRAAAQARASDARFRDLFDAHPVPMWIYDRDTLVFLAVNDAAISQYGYSETEFKAMTLREIRPSDESDRFDVYLSRIDGAQADGHRMAGVWRHVRRDGSTLSAEISCHPLIFDGHSATFTIAHDLTDQLKAEAEAHRASLMLESIIDSIPQRIFWKDRESRYLGCNAAFARDVGLAYPEQVVGKFDRELPWPGHTQFSRRADRLVVAARVPNLPQEVDLSIDQENRTIVLNLLPLKASDGGIIGVLGCYDDVTDARQADLALRLQSRALDASVNAIVITEPTAAGNAIAYVNPAFRRITGYAPDEVIGQDMRLLQAGDNDQEDLAEIREALRADREVSALVRNYRKDGELFWNRLYIAPVPDACGRTTHHIAVINDVSDLVKSQEQLEYQANYDALTGLPNRVLLRDRLEGALQRARRTNTTVAVVFIDLDGFKNVNDSLGHSVGDRLLVILAHRLVACARTTDTVARLGGDEFVVVLTDGTDETSLIAWMERVRLAVAEAVWVDDAELYVGCSMGASISPQDGVDVETLMKKADFAMYRAKEAGRNGFQFYQPEMNDSVGARLDLERRLRRALRDGEFLLHYQPQTSMATGQIIGVEALIRWRDPEIGLVSPAAFIPVAEECGLIAPIGEWVLAEACRQNKAWQDAGLPPIRVSVNVSARQFHGRHISNLVTSVLSLTGLEPRYLEIELTESAIMSNADDAAAVLTELHGLGVGLAIDDFGTGYSSLGYLKRFPVDRLKIDRSFVSDIGRSDGDETITSAIIALAHSLHLKVIAEGVETAAQQAFLRERGCDEMQGYFFSRPVPGEAIPGLLEAGLESAETGTEQLA